MLKDIKDKSIKEEGERMVPAFHKGFLVYGEHIVRYESISHLVKDKVVLDIASGSGYGTYIIAESAKKVYGVEIDEESVKYSKKNYSRNNIEYLLGDGESIPLPDKSVDTIVTFETIEHIKNYKKFLDETKRILKPGGLLIVSTPNDLEFPEGNHFHLHEFTQKELDSLLKKYYQNVKFTYQFTWQYSAVLPETLAGKDQTFALETHNTAPINKDKAIYFMALCSDSDIRELETKNIAAISEHWSSRKAQETEESRQRTAKELEEVKQQHQEVSQKYKQVNENLQAIYNSRGWKLLTKLYRLRQRLSSLAGRK